MKFQDRILKVAGAIQSNSYIGAITAGLMSAMPITLIGGIGSLINGLPLPVYQEFLTSTGLKTLTAIPTEITTNLLSLYMVYLIANKFCESKNVDGLPAGILALMAFLVVTPYTVNDKGVMAAYAVNWLGATGLFTAFIIALMTAKIYTVFMEKGWTIKMPAGVPPTVSKSFSGLIPGFVIALVAIIIRGLVMMTPFGDLHTLIFQIIASPLTKLGNTFPALIIAILTAQILWVFGIHGAMIVFSVFLAIWTPLGAENLAAYSNGLPVPNLISGSLFAQALAMGSGQTLGLAICMLRAKSDQYKTLGKLSIIPNICGINEPIIFGTPLVMNFTLAIPFIGVPLITLVSSYLLCLFNVLPYLPGISAPLGTPIIIHGLIAGGWKWAIFQVIMIGVSYICYRPFFNKLDQQAYNEQTQQAPELVTE